MTQILDSNPITSKSKSFYKGRKTNSNVVELEAPRRITRSKAGNTVAPVNKENSKEISPGFTISHSPLPTPLIYLPLSGSSCSCIEIGLESLFKIHISVHS